MNDLSESELKEAHAHSSNHHSEVMESNVCGCFYCGQTFLPSAIQEWIDEGKCALCPKCGIDAVIGDASGYKVNSQSFLDQMHTHWFEQ